MTTATQLFTDRDTAGAAYVTALANLKTAWINLRAADMACGSPRVLGLHPSGATKTPVATFVTHVATIPELYHPTYNSAPESMSVWSDAAKAAAVTSVNGAT